MAFGRRDAGKAAVGAGIVFTFILHAALVAAIIVGTMHGEENIKEEIEPQMLRFEEVDLLALGEEKPPNQLPRIANPEPEVAPPDEINLAKPQEPVVDLEKEEEKEKKEEDDDARKKKMLDALSALHNPNRPTNEDIPEGAAEGVVGGDITDAALANLMNTYVAKLVGELSRYWEVPSTIPPAEIQQLAGQVVVYVRLSESGHVVTYQFREESSNEQFNLSIERLIRRFQVSGGGRTLPLPEEEEVRAVVIREGLNLSDWEYTGR
jgi:outer membrane biosynthesis protein TonB